MFVPRAAAAPCRADEGYGFMQWGQLHMASMLNKGNPAAGRAERAAVSYCTDMQPAEGCPKRTAEDRKKVIKETPKIIWLRSCSCCSPACFFPRHRRHRCWSGCCRNRCSLDLQGKPSMPQLKNPEGRHLQYSRKELACRLLHRCRRLWCSRNIVVAGDFLFCMQTDCIRYIER